MWDGSEFCFNLVTEIDSLHSMEEMGCEKKVNENFDELAMKYIWQYIYDSIYMKYIWQWSIRKWIEIKIIVRQKRREKDSKF